MTPAQAIAALDRQLARHGKTVMHHVMANGAPVMPGTPCRAFMRQMKPDELIGGLTQKDRKVTISPTSIAAISEGDRIVTAGKAYRVEVAEPLRVDGVVVRFNMTVKG